MIESIKALINKILSKVDKTSPTATDLHVPVPMSSDKEEHVNKMIADYKKICQKLEQLKSESAEQNKNNDQEVKIDTEGLNQTSSEVYRGKAF